MLNKNRSDSDKALGKILTLNDDIFCLFLISLNKQKQKSFIETRNRLRNRDFFLLFKDKVLHFLEGFIKRDKKLWPLRRSLSSTNI